VVAPYFSRFFEVIDKDHPTQVTFEELLPSLVIFCLLTREEMFAFVFSMLDEDRNDEISKVDLFRFLMQFRDGMRIFPGNLTRSIEITYMKRGDTISQKDFYEITNKVPYVGFPAFRLQYTMREKFGGSDVWNRAKQLLESKEAYDNLMAERNRLKKRQDMLKAVDLAGKLKYFHDQKEVFMVHYNRKNELLRNPTRQIRIHKRRASDGMYKVNMEAIFEEKIRPR